MKHWKKALCSFILVICMVHANAQTSPEVFIRRGHRKGISAIAFSKAGEVMASAGREGEVLVWNAATGALLHRLQTDGHPLNAVDISGDGKWIAAGGDGPAPPAERFVFVWNLATGALWKKLKVNYHLSAVAFSASGDKLLTSTLLGGIEIRDTRNFESLWNYSLSGDYSNLEDICFGPGDSVVFASVQNGAVGEIRIDSRQKRSLSGPCGETAFLHWDSGRNVLAVSRDSLNEIVDITTGKKTAIQPVSGKAKCIALRPDSPEVVMGMSDGSIQLQETSTMKTIWITPAGEFPIYKIAYSPDGKYFVSADESGRLRKWSNTGDLMLQFEGGASQITHLAISPDGNTLMAGSSNRHVRTIHLPTLEHSLLDLWSPASDLSQMSFLNGGKSAVISFEDAALMYMELVKRKKAQATASIESGKYILFESHPDSACAVVLAPDGTLFQTGADENCKVPARTMPYHAAMKGYRMKKDGKLFYAIPGRHGFAGEKEQKTSAGNEVLKDIAVNPGETLVAELVDFSDRVPAAEDIMRGEDITCRVRIYSLPDLNLVKEFYPYIELPEYNRQIRMGASSVAFDPSGNILALGHNSGNIWLYETKTWTLASSLRGHEDEVKDMCWFPDGNKLASGSRDGTLRLWDLSTKRTLARIVFSDESYAILGDTFYMSPSAGLEAIGFRKGMKEYPGEVFDLRYNAPDKIAARLSSAPLVAERFRKLREARMAAMKKADFKENFFLSWDNAPASALVNTDTISFSVSSPIGGNGKFTVLVNNVPDGNAIPRTSGSNFRFVITLNAGMNEIQVIQKDENGFHTPPLRAFVFRRELKTLPDLYLTGIAVPAYTQLVALPNTVEDIRALVKTLKTKEGILYNKVFVDTIFGEKFNAASLQKEHLKVSASRPGDISVVYFSGHGLLSDQMEYFIATHNTDPKDLKEAVPYQALEAVSAAGAARARLLLVNACHGGEAAGDQKTFDAMKAFYYDVRESHGETVIAGSAAQQQALGNVASGKNTAFGFALVSVLKNNPTLTVGELSKKLESELNKLTYGEQQPAVRRVNTKMNFRIW